MGGDRPTQSYIRNARTSRWHTIGFGHIRACEMRLRSAGTDLAVYVCVIDDRGISDGFLRSGRRSKQTEKHSLTWCTRWSELAMCYTRYQVARVISLCHLWATCSAARPRCHGRYCGWFTLRDIPLRLSPSQRRSSCLSLKPNPHCMGAAWKGHF